MEPENDALAVLSRAGIQREDGGSFAEWLTGMADRAAKQVEQAPVIAKIRNMEDYQYCKAALAAYRKVEKEAEEGRKAITSQLDAAKKAVMSFTADSISPVKGGIGSMSRLQKEYEDKGRAEKRARLEAWWEQSYPLLALCTGEAEEPLVPFSRIFDVDWVKRVGELGKDDKAHEAMSALADGIAAAQSEIEAAGLDPDVRSLALSRLFDTLDPCGNIAWATEQARRQRDLERVQAAVVPEAAPVEPEPEKAPRAASPRCAAERFIVALDMPCEPPCERVLCVWADGDDELGRAMGAMKGAGLHGAIGKVM